MQANIFIQVVSFLYRYNPANTSCGLTLKLLRKTPIYTDGNSVVMITTPPGGGGNSASRSLFGGGPGMSGIRSKILCE